MTLEARMTGPLVFVFRQPCLVWVNVIGSLHPQLFQLAHYLRDRSTRSADGNNSKRMYEVHLAVGFPFSKVNTIEAC